MQAGTRWGGRCGASSPRAVCGALREKKVGEGLPPLFFLKRMTATKSPPPGPLFRCTPPAHPASGLRTLSPPPLRAALAASSSRSRGAAGSAVTAAAGEGPDTSVAAAAALRGPGRRAGGRSGEEGGGRGAGGPASYFILRRSAWFPVVRHVHSKKEERKSPPLSARPPPPPARPPPRLKAPRPPGGVRAGPRTLAWVAATRGLRWARDGGWRGPPVLPRLGGCAKGLLGPVGLAAGWTRP